MGSTITRDTWTNDTGTAANPNLDGTIINNNALQNNIYARIDEMFDGAGAYATFTLDGVLSLASGQIVFPATQNASAGANTLDDYEEGTFTPTWTNLTIGNGTHDGAYIKIGRLVFVRILLTFGSTTSIAGAVSVDLPVNANVGTYAVGFGDAVDSGTAEYFVFARLTDTNTAALLADNGTSLVSITSTVPFTWVTSDVLLVSFTYTATG